MSTITYNNILLSLLMLLGTFLLLPTMSYAQVVPVNIVGGDPNSGQPNLAQNRLTAQNTAQILELLQQLIDKEFVYDPNQNRDTREAGERLTAETVRFANSGSNGDPVFPQIFSDHWVSVSKTVFEDYIQDDVTRGVCEQHDDFIIQTSVIQHYSQRFENPDQQYQCTLDDSSRGTNRSVLTQMLIDSRDCTNDFYCSILERQDALDQRIANAVLNEREAMVEGVKPIRAIRRSTTSDGRVVEENIIATPATLVKESLRAGIVDTPMLQMVTTDEYQEEVDDFMANLTRFSLSGVNGLLGLGGNPDYSNNVFGPEGNVSYINILSEGTVDTIDILNINPIQDALNAEIVYEELQTGILDVILDFEERLDAGRETYEEYNCFDLTLSNNLETLKEDTLENIEVSSTTQAILLVLSDDYASAIDLDTQNSILADFFNLQQQGFFRTDFDNRSLQLTFIEIEFIELINEFEERLQDELGACAAEKQRRETATADDDVDGGSEAGSGGGK